MDTQLLFNMKCADQQGWRQQAPGGIRGRVIAKKKEEMQDYTERLKILISHYAPPDPQMIREAKEAGNAGLAASNGIAILTFTDYYKPGDKVSVGFDAAAKKLVSYNVNTYLDDPKNDVVTLTGRFGRLPDGTNYNYELQLHSRSCSRRDCTKTTVNSFVKLGATHLNKISEPLRTLAISCV